MNQYIHDIRTKAFDAISRVTTQEELHAWELLYLSRKGEVNTLAKTLGSLPLEERKSAGASINELKTYLETLFQECSTKLQEMYYASLDTNEYIDLSLPRTPSFSFRGGRHPIALFIEEIQDIFLSLGFDQAVGPEIEDEWHNFTALNLNADHPARDMQDTFFIKDVLSKETYDDERDRRLVLRTQTSSVQIRHMLSSKPPYRIFVPGKVFRRDSDATHSPMFHQIEGLFIEKHVTLEHLKAVMLEFFQAVFRTNAIDLRFRTSYFPFTEPSLEVDILFRSRGMNRFLEVGGAGMVHPNVLKNGGLDPQEWNGFAFGMGVERLFMIRSGLNDLRKFYENDRDFLKQFS